MATLTKKERDLLSKKRAQDLVDEAVKARALGMTYGEYQTYKFFQEERKIRAAMGKKKKTAKA